MSQNSGGTIKAEETLTIQDAITVIKREKECVTRNINKDCDRDCGNCNLVLPDDVILEGHVMALSALRAQEAREKGCEYCKSVGKQMNRSCKRRWFINPVTKELQCDTDIICEERIAIKYCPMCGRALNKAPIKEEPLTLEELKERIGKPVWFSRARRWGVLGIHRGKEERERLVVGLSYGWEWIEDIMCCGEQAYDHEQAREEKGNVTE